MVRTVHTKIDTVLTTRLCKNRILQNENPA